MCIQDREQARGQGRRAEGRETLRAAAERGLREGKEPSQLPLLRRGIAAERGEKESEDALLPPLSPAHSQNPPSVSPKSGSKSLSTLPSASSMPGIMTGGGGYAAPGECSGGACPPARVDAVYMDCPMPAPAPVEAGVKDGGAQFGRPSAPVVAGKGKPPPCCCCCCCTGGYGMPPCG